MVCVPLYHGTLLNPHFNTSNVATWLYEKAPLVYEQAVGKKQKVADRPTRRTFEIQIVEGGPRDVAS